MTCRVPAFKLDQRKTSPSDSKEEMGGGLQMEHLPAANLGNDVELSFAFKMAEQSSAFLPHSQPLSP